MSEMQTAPEDAETRRSLKNSAELPTDGPKSEVRGRGLHLDDDVSIVTTTDNRLSDLRIRQKFT